MSQCYCVHLRQAARKVTAFYDEALAPVGIGVAQFSLLRNIARAESPSLTELGRRIELDRSTVGRNIRVLERMGLVKTKGGEDQREATVALTKKGEQVIAKGAPLWEKAQARIEAVLGDNTRTLQALLQNL
jgi:DNA-binding MarR family transcriptional regulator